MMKKNNLKKNPNELAIKMVVALILGLIAGTSFIFLREYLNGNGKGDL